MSYALIDNLLIVFAKAKSKGRLSARNRELRSHRADQLRVADVDGSTGREGKFDRQALKLTLVSSLNNTRCSTRT
jgi:hypothetical protein